METSTEGGVSLRPYCRLQCPGLQPRDRQNVRRAKALAMDHPAAKQIRRILGHLTRGQDFKVCSERDIVGQWQSVVFVIVMKRKGQTGQEIGRRHSVGPKVNARRPPGREHFAPASCLPHHGGPIVAASDHLLAVRRSVILELSRSL